LARRKQNKEARARGGKDVKKTMSIILTDCRPLKKQCMVTQHVDTGKNTMQASQNGAWHSR
jgi:hypothetical protein